MAPPSILAWLAAWLVSVLSGLLKASICQLADKSFKLALGACSVDDSGFWTPPDFGF